MKDVNNFITDLIDEMEARKASDLLLEGGRVPYYYCAGRVIAVTSHEIVTAEEIVEDMEALGITVKDQMDKSYIHTANGGVGPNWFLKIRADIIDGNPSVSFRRIPNLSKGTNP